MRYNAPDTRLTQLIDQPYMKNTLYNLLAASLLLTSLCLNAQRRLQQLPEHLRQVQVPVDMYRHTGLEATIGLPEEEFKPYDGLLKVDQEVQIGRTIYDMQANSSASNRLSVRPDGRIVAVWTQGLELISFPDRGTGYNTRIDLAWDDLPEERIETVDSAWPNHVFTASGAEFILAHSTGGVLTTSRRASPMSEWSQSTIPSSVPGGSLWPRAAVGGPDGESIHVIAITRPVFNNGTPYQGVDGHVLYHRSLDGGATWDQVDVELDGLGAEFTVASRADAYSLDVRGDTVAFALFNDWDDILLFKSTDNGDTWNKTIIHDFPLDRYVADDGYSTTELPPLEEGQPNPRAIRSCDSYGSLVLDNDGQAHVFYGNMWVIDAFIGDGTYNYFIRTDGISYWNETNGLVTNELVGVEDQNGNGVVDVESGADVALYFASLTSMPSAGIDADNNLYLVYSSVIEGDVSTNIDRQHYRHIYVISSSDGGNTWTEPLDLITEDVVLEPQAVDAIEAVYPIMARNVDGKVRLIYQQDGRPGIAVRGDQDFPGNNSINYIQLDVSELGIVQTTEQVDTDVFDLRLAPNVTSGRTLLSYTLQNKAEVGISVVNAHGQLLKQLDSQTLTAGTYNEQIDLSTFPSGVYYLILQADHQYSSIEVIKQ